MEQSTAKKARVDAIYRQGMQDVVRLEAAATGGANGAAATGGANGGSPLSTVRGVAIVQMDFNWFRCPVCSGLFEPHVFQCKRGHLACGGCPFDGRNRVVEDIISVSKFKCPHSGCHGFFSYADLRAHRGDCRHAPCFCAEPGCTFAAPPPGLLRHLAADHSWPVHRLGYGKVLWFPAPLSEPRRLLLAEDDGRVFVVVVGALGAVTAVSVVCVRRTAGGPSQPQYTARLGASGPPPPGAAKGRPTRSPMETVTSSERPGEVTVDKLPWVLPVPSSYLLTGADGASKVVSVKISIQKISGH